MDRAEPKSERVWQSLEGMAGAIWVLVILLVTLLALRGHVSAETIGLALIIPVLVAALSGRTVALGMAIACALLFNILFIPPYYSLSIGSSQGITAFIVYIAVAIAVVIVAGRLRQINENTERRVRRREELLAISERLLRGDEPAAVVASRIDRLGEAMGVPTQFEPADEPVSASPWQRRVPVDEGVAIFAAEGELDADQAATIDELERLLAAQAGAPLASAADVESVFWDVG
jgi:K+-sensing histidine kinase KdpD